MAKRKRLTPANPTFLGRDAPTPMSPLAAAPIAGVAREASATAAAEEMAQTLNDARRDGRMVIAVPLEQVQLDYLVRDRVAVDAADMQALKDSLRARGQQTPVELVELEDGTGYGLISGWRRCAALRALFEETGEGRFAQVQGLLRRPDDAAQAYQAMVEENEIRVGLSYFERARIVRKAVAQGVFDRDRTALQTLFAAASRPRRSKIGSFLAVVDALDGVARHPEAISERLGLQIARRLGEDDGFAQSLAQALAAAEAQDAEAELAVLEAALAGSVLTAMASDKQALSRPEPGSETGSETEPEGSMDNPLQDWKQRNPRAVTPSIDLYFAGDGRLTLEGHGVDMPLRDDLIDWLRERSLQKHR